MSDNLSSEIAEAQQTVSTDQYPMSIGEMASMYRDGELILNPKFQRFYRWSISQKSALIESILIGIPVPPIFCYEREDSKWEIVDGLQRVSTILEFMGVLERRITDPDESFLLTETQYLPSLKNACWEIFDDGGPGKAIDPSIQIAFKRSKIGIQIIKKTSARNTKFDLFQRLNSNGSPLTPQEYRSCILVMINEILFDSVIDFAKLPAFRAILRLDAEDTDKQDDIDYACRLLTHCFREYERRDKDIDEFISETVKAIFLDNGDFVLPFLSQAKEAVSEIYTSLGENALRRLQEDGRVVGKAGRVGFETIVVGVVFNWPKIAKLPNRKGFIEAQVKSMWSQPRVNDFSSPGRRGTDRIRATVPFGKNWFQP